MIHSVVLTPSLTKADFLALCAEANLTYAIGSKGTLKVVKQENGKEFIPSLLSLQEFNRFRFSLEKSKYKILVLLREMRIGLDLERYDIQTWHSFRDLMVTKSEEEPIQLPPGLLPREHGAYTEVANRSMGNSILNQTQTLLYRIPKIHRTEIQKDVYGYLAGVTRHINRAGEYSPLLILLASEHMQKLRKASIEARKIGIREAADKYGVDRFDINYLLSTHNYSVGANE